SAVKETVRQDLRRERAGELARKGAEQARKSLAGGDSVTEVAAEYGAQARKVTGVIRADADQKLPDGLVAPVFSAVEGEAGRVQLGQGDQVVFRLTEVTDPARKEMEASQRQQLADKLREQRGQARMEALFDRLRQRYNVRIRREVGGGSG
ncbi:MAG: hypothetical protein ABEJ96_04840, partial [Thiohalorhabdaceae bacterium]